MEMTVLIADGQHLAGAVPGLQHLLGVLGGGGHGLLAENMLAGFQSGHSDLTVGDVGSQHVNRVDGGIGQQLVIVGIYLCVGGAVLFRGFLGTLGDQVAESAQIYILSLLGHAGQMLLVGDAAAADKANF